MDHSPHGLKIIIRNNDGTSSDITMYSDDGKMPSTIEIGGAAKMADIEVTEVEIAENDQLLEKDDSEEPTTKTKSKKSKWVGIYSTIQECLTALCALVTTVIMIMTLVKFYSTSHIADAWPTSPKLYPTYLLLITSLITLVIDVFSLGERYCRASATKNVDNMISKMRYGLLVFQAIGSATGAGVFKGTQASGSAQDLFGWACSDAADQMGNVNSSNLICNSNTSSSILALLQMSLHILGIVITVVTMLGPKGDDSGDSIDSGDIEARPNVDQKKKRASCSSCGKPTSSSKLDWKKSNEKPNRDENASKLGEPQVEMEAIKLIDTQSQSQALYSRLESSQNPKDVSHYGELDFNSMRRGHSATDMDTPQTRYDDFDMQAFR